MTDPLSDSSSASKNIHQGLSSADAEVRARLYGPNELQREKSQRWWTLLAAQFINPMAALLAAGSGVSLALGEVTDALVIGIVLVINGLVGFAQEYRAEQAVLALRNMTAAHARVLRDGRARLIPASSVVPGDSLLLEAGDLVAADAQLLEAYELQMQEAALTGESLPVTKSLQPVAEGAPLAEQTHKIFMGTAVVCGTAIARVTAIGGHTQLGRIAGLLSSANITETPLQQRLGQLSRVLIYLCIGIVILVAAMGLYRGDAWLNVLLTAISLAVAAVPEGLPAIVTIALAVGVQRMAARQVLVRHLHAVESLGCATVICTDKTGTLTTGIMKVREVWPLDNHATLAAAAACCDAELSTDGTGIGDPTELAILAAARELGIERQSIETTTPRTGVLPFDSIRMFMAVTRTNGITYVKGALEALIPRCDQAPDHIQSMAAEMAQKGLRVLAVATSGGDTPERLTMLGLIGMADPPRKEAMDAVAAARRAGVKIIMITGDHPVTARAIATEMGILTAADMLESSVHARATPEEKLNIVRELKANGAVVAMTGDGVNDAPALREAHVGIAMGVTGTEVTREASDMILTDDNFASIVAALREGRGIFDNIRKTVAYLLAGNVAELSVMLVAAMIGLPTPLLPLHILWINLATDVLPALALVTDPAAPETMQRPPRRPDEPLLGREEWLGIMIVGVIQTVATLGIFAWALATRDLVEARNLAFTTLVFGELFRAFGARSKQQTFWQIGLFSNLRLFSVITISVALQISIHHIPALQSLLHIGSLSLGDCLLTLVIGLCPLLAVDIWKLAARPRAAKMTGL